MKSPLSGDPTIKILPIFILLSSLYVTGQTAHASICLFLGPIGDVAPVVVVFDNQMAGYSAHGFTATHDDANMTLGAAVFNGAVGGFDVAVSTAVSKPVLQGNAIDLIRLSLEKDRFKSVWPIMISPAMDTGSTVNWVARLKAK